MPEHRGGVRWRYQGEKINQTNDEILNETQGKKITFFPSPLLNNAPSFPVDKIIKFYLLKTGKENRQK